MGDSWIPGNNEDYEIVPSDFAFEQLYDDVNRMRIEEDDIAPSANVQRSLIYHNVGYGNNMGPELSHINLIIQTDKLTSIVMSKSAMLQDLYETVESKMSLNGDFLLCYQGEDLDNYSGKTIAEMNFPQQARIQLIVRISGGY